MRRNNSSDIMSKTSMYRIAEISTEFSMLTGCPSCLVILLCTSRGDSESLQHSPLATAVFIVIEISR